MMTDITTGPMPHGSPFTSTDTKCHILIIGCGLGGLAAAIAIRKVGHEVTILEKRAELQELGAGINISPNATRLFQGWGILRAVEERSTHPYGAFMRSYKDHAELSNQRLGDLMGEIYSTPYLIIHRADLHSILLQEAKRLHVIINLDVRFATINFSEPSVATSDGRRYVADAIIGADGERSSCRDALYGYSLPPRDSGDHVFRVTVKTSDIIHHEDLVDLVQPPCINFWVGPSAFCMAYPLKKDDVLSLTLTCAHDPSTEVEHVPHRVDVADVRRDFSKWNSKFQKVLDLARGCSKWTLFEAPEVAYWTHPDGKFTLLGDSAHVMLPFLGQGASMAFEDAAVLGTLLSDIRHKVQLPDIFSIYESIRKPRTTALRARSQIQRAVNAFQDGPLQQERDRQLRHLPPFEGFPNFLADPGLQKLLFGYNATREAEIAWERYLRGEWPSTRGYWDVSTWPT